MFKSMMDGFLVERAKADQDKKQLQSLLAKAVKVSRVHCGGRVRVRETERRVVVLQDIAFLSTQNQELQATINQVVYAEPPIRN
jgi:hypothetical protein